MVTLLDLLNQNQGQLAPRMSHQGLGCIRPLIVKHDFRVSSCMEQRSQNNTVED